MHKLHVDLSCVVPLGYGVTALWHSWRREYCVRRDEALQSEGKRKTLVIGVSAVVVKERQRDQTEQVKTSRE